MLGEGAGSRCVRAASRLVRTVDSVTVDTSHVASVCNRALCLTAPSSQRRPHSAVLTAPSSQRRLHSAVLTAPSSQRRLHSAILTAPSSQRRLHSAVLAAPPSPDLSLESATKSPCSVGVLHQIRLPPGTRAGCLNPGCAPVCTHSSDWFVSRRPTKQTASQQASRSPSLSLNEAICGSCSCSWGSIANLGLQCISTGWRFGAP